MMGLKYMVIIIVMLSHSCTLDFFDEQPKEFVGEIYFKKSTKDSYLIFGKNYSTDGSYDFIIREPIIEALGNDSIIFAKSLSEEKIFYTMIKHTKGLKVIDQTSIDSLTYSNSSKNKIFKYTYSHNQ